MAGYYVNDASEEYILLLSLFCCLYSGSLFMLFTDIAINITIITVADVFVSSIVLLVTVTVCCYGYYCYLWYVYSCYCYCC